MNTNFYSLWFDPTGSRTRVYRFSSRRSIHSATDRLNFNFSTLTLTIFLRNTFPFVQTEMMQRFFPCFSAEKSLKALISSFLSSIVVMYVLEFDKMVVERVW